MGCSHRQRVEHRQKLQVKALRKLELVLCLKLEGEDKVGVWDRSPGTLKEATRKEGRSRTPTRIY
jgi:hypothetical protein